MIHGTCRNCDEELVAALKLILMTHGFSCKGEDCQISGIDLGYAALAKRGIKVERLALPMQEKKDQK